MPKRGSHIPRRIAGDPADPAGWPVLVGEFCDWMGAHGYSPRTIDNRRGQLAVLVDWLAERGVTRPVEVTRPQLERYQRWLFHYRKPDGNPLSFRSQSQRLLPVRAFFRWAARANVVLYNPASEIELPKVERRLPRPALTAAEAEQVLAGCDLATPAGLRDRAMLEVLYSTGIRRSELAGLSLFDLDIERSTLLVRQGKGRKDRLSPRPGAATTSSSCAPHAPGPAPDGRNGGCRTASPPRRPAALAGRRARRARRRPAGRGWTPGPAGAPHRLTLRPKLPFGSLARCCG